MNEQTFHHTHVGTYLCAVCVVACIFHDSVQGVTQRFHLSKRWFYLYGATLFFAYLYIRPLIRKGLGSAERGYINFSTVYIVWLCSAVFYHLPSMETLGIDIKADISLLLTVFVSSFVALGVLHVIHGVCVALKLLRPCLLSPTIGVKELLSMLMLNSVCLAVACSTYYGFCGNSGEASPLANSSLKQMVCGSWLHPVPPSHHPGLPWVLLGDLAPSAHAGHRSLNATSSANTSALAVSQGGLPGAPEPMVSPVFMMWFTLVMLFVVNCGADYAAATAMETDDASRLRKGHIDLPLGTYGSIAPLGPRLSELRGRSPCARGDLRRRSLELHPGWRPGWDLNALGTPRRHSLEESGQHGMFSAASRSVEMLCSSLTDLKRTWHALAATLPIPLHLTLDPGRPQGGSPTSGMSRSSSVNSLDSFRFSDTDLRGVYTSERQWTNEDDYGHADRPSFLPMFPWYSGTSADLLKTALDLIVSVKLFLGRFDMRTMHASLAGQGGVAKGGGDVSGPHPGDGYLYDHLANARELWFDFTADTGDGGDPTYAVARMMAAPSLTVGVPASWAAAGKQCGVQEQEKAACQSRLKDGTVVRELPRGNVLIHGGDLAYPNPCKDTYEKRLFKPYEAAFPPPPDIHPAHLIVNKPDLPEIRAMAAAGAWRRGPVGSPAGLFAGCSCSHARGSGAVQCPPCPVCLKVDALRRHDGPCSFLIPGNHDWFDGLDTFNRHILHKGWLGGWLMPQEASYFALRLPHGWWLFGCDMALDEDIDICQFRYFAAVADTLMGPDDQAIILTHQPRWLLDWYWGERLSPNLRQLLRRHLRGRARLHIAGDLHFYMRHSQQAVQSHAAAQQMQEPAEPWTNQYSNSFMHAPPTLRPHSQDKGACGMPRRGSHASLSSLGGSPRGGSPRGGSPRGTSPLRGMSAHWTDLSTGPASDWRQLWFVVKRHRFYLITELLDLLLEEEWQGTVIATHNQVTGPSAAPGPVQDSFGSHVSGLGATKDSSGTSTLANTIPAARRGEQYQAVPSGHAAHGAAEAVKPAAAEAVYLRGPSPNGDASTTDAGGSDRSNSCSDEGVLSPASIGHTEHGLELPAPAAATAQGSMPQRCTVSGRADRIDCKPATLQVRGDASSPFTLGSTAVTTTAAQAAVSAVGSSPNAAQWQQRLEARGASPEPFEGAHAGHCDTRSLGCEGVSSSWNSTDPEHYVVCGMGGAFLHPTHVFSQSQWQPSSSAVDGPAFVQRNVHGAARLSTSSFRTDDPPTLQYNCTSSYPAPSKSYTLGRDNLGLFRLHNTRFDVIGGLLYYALVVSVVPRCGMMAHMMSARTCGEAVSLFASSIGETLAAIFQTSYLSMLVLAGFLLFAYSFACGGGVGCLSHYPPPPQGKQGVGKHGESLHPSQVFRCRMGGLTQRLLWAVVHASCHLLTAVVLVLLLELGIETCIRYESVGEQGYHSLYKWYRTFEEQHFPDPQGLRSVLQRYTLGLYPAVLKWLMAVFDVPEAIAVTRETMCRAGGTEGLTRLQTIGFYAGVLAYFWLLATPAVGYLFGAYLYCAVNIGHVHYDEAFSSLRIPNYKGFCRFHITPQGDLEMFALAQDRIPCEWREDPRWRGAKGGGALGMKAQNAKYPSRWAPAGPPDATLGPSGYYGAHGDDETCAVKVVDYLLVPKQRKYTN